MVQLIGKRTISSRPVALFEVSEIMEKRLADAEEEMKKKKKEKKVAEKPLPEPSGEGKEPGEAAVSTEETKPVEEKSPLGLEQRSALEYAKKFSKLGKRNSAELMEKLMAIQGMKPEIAVKVVDILPYTAEQVKLLFAKERANVNEEQVSKILELVGEFRK